MKTRDVTVVGEIYVDHVMSGFAAWPGLTPRQNSSGGKE